MTVKISVFVIYDEAFLYLVLLICMTVPLTHFHTLSLNEKNLPCLTNKVVIPKTSVSCSSSCKF